MIVSNAESFKNRNVTMSKKKALFLWAMFCGNLLAKQSDTDFDQPKIGNLSLPGSQQPSALLGFGQNIVDKNDFQLFVFTDCFAGRDKKLTEVIPSILYGIRDDLSLCIQFPVAAKFQNQNQCSSGAEDFSAQFEYVLHTHKMSCATNQVTLVGSMFAPQEIFSKIHPRDTDQSVFC